MTDTTARAIAQRRAASPVVWMGWLLAPVILALYALKPFGPVKDPDAYWHVVAGEHLLQTGQFVLADPFGAGTEKVWILNQWLPEVLMHWMQAEYGLSGVAWLLCLGTLLVGVTIFAACRRRASRVPTALVLAVAFLGISGSLSPRPQLVTFALTSVTTSAWLLTREDRRARWWLVPLTWLWACSHGMWFVGPVVGGVVVAGLLLERRLTSSQAARLSLVPLLSVGAAAITPIGPKLFSSPFQVAGVTAYISEWQRPRLSDVATMAALALVVLVGFYLMGRVRREWTTVLLLVLALGLILTWSRTVGLGAVILAPLAARALQSLVSRPPAIARKSEWVGVAVAGFVSLSIVGLLAPTVAAAPGLGPNGMDATLSRLPAGTVVCNDQGDGGWFMLRHPSLRPTMDTRVELYSIEHIQAYLGFMAGDPGWQAYAARLGCGYAVLHADAAVVPSMRAVGGWELVEETGGYVLLRSPA